MAASIIKATHGIRYLIQHIFVPTLKSSDGVPIYNRTHHTLHVICEGVYFFICNPDALQSRFVSGEPMTCLGRPMYISHFVLCFWGLTNVALLLM